MPLIEVPRPEGNYLILEGISREKKVSKGLFIVNNLEGEDASAKMVKNMFNYLFLQIFILGKRTYVRY